MLALPRILQLSTSNIVPRYTYVLWEYGKSYFIDLSHLRIIVYLHRFKIKEKKNLPKRNTNHLLCSSHVSSYLSEPYNQDVPPIRIYGISFYASSTYLLLPKPKPKPCKPKSSIHMPSMLESQPQHVAP